VPPVKVYRRHIGVVELDPIRAVVVLVHDAVVVDGQELVDDDAGHRQARLELLQSKTGGDVVRAVRGGAASE
jgi:hypothetical protein